MCCKIERNGYMSGKIEFLYLNEEDMIKAGVLDMEGCLKAVEDMFVLLDRRDYRMGG